MINSTLFSRLSFGSVRFWPDTPHEVGRTAGGAIIKGSIGNPLWRGEGVLNSFNHAKAAEVEAELMEAAEPGNSILAFDPRFNGPRSDPNGVILGSNIPLLHTVSADNRSIRISGLPPQYVFSAGDYVGWQYGSFPVRYAFHRFVTGATASASGLTPLMRVNPFVQPGFTTGLTQVSLIRPVFKAVLEVELGEGGILTTEGASFQLIQTFR